MRTTHPCIFHNLTPDSVPLLTFRKLLLILIILCYTIIFFCHTLLSFIVILKMYKIFWRIFERLNESKAIGAKRSVSLVYYIPPHSLATVYCIKLQGMVMR